MTNFLKFVLLKLFRAALLVYVDDCFTAEPSETVTSALGCVKFTCATFGLMLEERKERPPSDTIELLGDRVKIFPHELEASLPDRRKTLGVHR